MKRDEQKMSNARLSEQRRLIVQALGAGAIGMLGPVSQARAVTRDAEPGTQPDQRQHSMYAYVGSRTTRERNARGDGISIFRFNADDGRLDLVDVAKGIVNPSFLAISKDGNFLYTVHGDLSDISAFAIDKRNGGLRLINRQNTRGNNPVHLAIDPSGKYMVVSNHLSSNLAVLPIAADGSLGEVSQVMELTGPIGPHRVEQKMAKPHFNAFDPSGQFVIVPDKGLDRTFTFRFVDGKLLAGTPPFVVSREGAGPRHLAFHPNGQFVYVVNELDSTVTVYRYARANGALTPLQILPTLSPFFTGNSRASEIEVSRDGRFLYASNRGDDSIAIFTMDASTGLLAYVANQKTLGKTPRFFTQSPNGRHLYALNEESDSIVQFNVERDSGKLIQTGPVIQSGSPVCMVFAPAV